MKKLLTKRQRKQILSLLIGLVLIGIVWAGERFGLIQETGSQVANVVQSSQPGLYKITKFEDGDTVTVDMNGISERVRMIGVDTPETQDPRVPVQCFGKAASQFTKDLIGGNDVRLEADPTNTNRDRYNRLLRYVYLPDGRLVNSEIISQGYGFAYTLFPFEKLEEFRNLERQAREANRGLWEACQIQQNGDKKTTSPA